MNTIKSCAAFLLALSAFASLGRSETVTITNTLTIEPGDMSYEGKDIVVTGARLTINGAHSFASLQLLSGAVVAHAAAPNGESDRWLNLTIAQDVFVDSSSRMDVSSAGYGGDAGPGRGASGPWGAGGGGYGGPGGSAATAGGPAYGQIEAPADWGSGGGVSGGAGGGWVRIKAGNLFRLEGQVVANGGPGRWYEGMWRGGGGSGGSVVLDVGEFTGSGTISARGGPGAYRSDAYQSGGGGGGRIAVRALTNSFTGAIQASGGVGNGTGGAGTVYWLTGTNPVGALIIDNEQQAGAFTPIGSPSQLVSLTVSGKAFAGPLIPLTVGGVTVADQGELRQAPEVTNIVLNVTGDVNLTQAGVINANCQLTIGGNLVVATNSAILADGLGYQPGPGPGKGDDLSYGAGGGGHGGEGGKTVVGAPGDKTYGSLTEPVDGGSGGGIGIGNGSGAPGGSGGGSIRIVVAGTVSLEGRLSANGAAGAFYESMKVGGGGAGGSVWLTVGGLEGTGTISAHGGNGGSNAGQASSAGGGAGGRIAVYYGFNRFAGQTAAFGGDGVERGGAGTVYLKAKDHAVGRLSIGNGGFLGRGTPVSSPLPFYLAIADQALVYPVAALTLSGLEVGPGGVLTHLAGQANLDLTVLGDASIAPNGQIHANGKGNPGGQGPGTGGSGQYGAGGAGYGGAGAVSRSSVAGGGTYGSESEPTDWGSGGGLGLGNGGPAPGGAGGGALRLTVNGGFSVDGYLGAEGDNGAFYESMKVGGGGSGGSILLRVGSLSGIGYISAKGGLGGVHTFFDNAGGGGGGRIAIYYGSMSGFSLSHITVDGGTGANTGAGGTIFLVSTATPPDFSQQPLEQTTGLGRAVTFQVSVTGTGPFSYQWFLDGVELPGATNVAYTVASTDSSSAGSYTIRVTNDLGSKLSNPAVLSLVRLEMFAGLVINGPIGTPYRIEYALSLDNANPWLALTNIVLPSRPYVFIDFDSPSSERRFYRAIKQP